MTLTKKQKDYIDNLLTEQVTEANLPDLHETIYDSCLDEYIIDLDTIPGDDSDNHGFDKVRFFIEIYSNLVWDYLESKK
jgi:hypothetical protein